MLWPGTEYRVILVKRRIQADSKKSTFPRAIHPQSLWIHLLKKSLVRGLWAWTRSLMAWKKSNFSPRAYKTLFSWDTGLPHLSLLLIKASDSAVFSHSCTQPKSCSSVLVQDHWSQWLCCSYLEGEARGTRLAQRDRPAHQFQYIRQASRLGAEHNEPPFNKEEQN